MHDRLLAILKALEQVIPPRQGCHHALMYTQYGSDDVGWSDQLTLQVHVAGVAFVPVFFDADDLDKPVDELVAEIKTVVQEAVKTWHASQP